MNIDWDQELEEYFKPQYLTSHMMSAQGNYTVTTLEGRTIDFSCSVQGYCCKCHGKTFELPMALLKEHSPAFIQAFNNQLFQKLKQLQEQQEEEMPEP